MSQCDILLFAYHLHLRYAVPMPREVEVIPMLLPHGDHLSASGADVASSVGLDIVDLCEPFDESHTLKLFARRRKGRGKEHPLSSLTRSSPFSLSVTMP